MEFNKHISAHTCSQWTLCEKDPYKKIKTQKKNSKHLKLNKNLRRNSIKKKFLEQVYKTYFS